MNLLNEVDYLGQPTFISGRDIVATILTLVAASWHRMRKRSDVGSQSTEPRIAGALYLEMRREKKVRGLNIPLLIEESPTRSDPDLLIGDGRIDLKMHYSFDEDDFFGLEYKRVSSTDNDLLEEYVTEGVMRYVTAKYCPDHDIVAMIGFVIDGLHIETATKLDGKLDKHRLRTSLCEDWQSEGSYPVERLYRTKHIQHGREKEMTILHLLLPFC